MKRILTIFLAVLLVVLSLSACSDSSVKLTINAPTETLTAETGSYDLPKYQVIDKDRVVLTEYQVVVKKVVDPDGNEVSVANNKINVTTPGVYTITYGVAEGDVADVKVKVEFEDNTAPILKMDSVILPKYFVKNMTYDMPAYQLSGDPDYSACYAKVLYFANEDAEGVEITVTNNAFTVEHGSGFYQILIHTADAWGNAKDYTFKVDAADSLEVMRSKIANFDEAIGQSQIQSFSNNWEFSYSSEVAWGDEVGSTRIVTNDATEYIILSDLPKSDVSDYEYLTFRIYNANEYNVYVAYTWFADIVMKAGEWTEFSIPVSRFETQNAMDLDDNRLTATNITGLAIRLFEDYDSLACRDGSTFYFSAMWATNGNPTDSNGI